MNRRLLAIALGLGLLAAVVVPFVRQSQAATCKWRNIAIGCNGDCVEIIFQDPAVNCPGSTVDVQSIGGCSGSWTTIATNVTSPVLVNCSNPGTSSDYRLVVHCSCGGDIYSSALGCTTCP